MPEIVHVVTEAHSISLPIGPAQSFFESHAAGLKEQIVGTWIAVSQFVDQEGKRLEPFGSDPKGMVVYDAGGRFVLLLQRVILPKFVSNNRMAGTPEENKEVEADTAPQPRFNGTPPPNMAAFLLA
jgi:Lipocalin-like domain